jgi:hypothetical protein
MHLRGAYDPTRYLAHVSLTGWPALDAIGTDREIQGAQHRPDILVAVGGKELGWIPHGHPVDRNGCTLWYHCGDVHDSIDSHFRLSLDCCVVKHCHPRCEKDFVFDCTTIQRRPWSDQHIVADPDRMSRHSSDNDVLAYNGLRSDLDRCSLRQNHGAETDATLSSYVDVAGENRGWRNIRRLVDLRFSTAMPDVHVLISCSVGAASVFLACTARLHLAPTSQAVPTAVDIHPSAVFSRTNAQAPKIPRRQ